MTLSTDRPRFFFLTPRLQKQRQPVGDRTAWRDMGPSLRQEKRQRSKVRTHMAWDW